MNDQSREKPNYERLNPIHAVKIIENYTPPAPYNIDTPLIKKIIFLRPFANTYMGYLDNDFFGFTVSETVQKYWLMEPKAALDHYFTHIFFHNPKLEYDMFKAKGIYDLYLSAIKMVKEKKK